MAEKTATPDWREKDRVQAIEDYEILDTPLEEDFDDIVKLAAQACNVPISLISFVTTGRQWFKASVGLEVKQTPLNVSICSHAILQKGLFVVPDTTKDPRFADNPLVTGDPNIRFYAGAPLETSDGLPLGTVCVVDYKPRTLSDQEAFTLNALARQVMTQLELRRALKAKSRSEERLQLALNALREANSMLGDKATHLEAIVQQRTQRLSESVAELEAFSYSISHDMRSPLRSMIGFAEILKEDYAAKLDDTGSEYLNRISRAARRMDRLIQDVLSFSRVSRQDVKLEPVAADDLMREILHSYPNLQPPFVEVSIKETLPSVKGNEALLTQCFSNLLENAAKFVAGGGKAKIEVWPESAEGRVKIFFKDSGIGMSEHNLERIFDIFQRVGRDTPGTGIGLSIVRKATEKMGGSVGVRSELGKGSLFWLDLQAS